MNHTLHPAHIQHQLEQMRQENQLLRTRLQDILEQAHRNQNIMERHQHFDLKIIGASHFEELISHIFSALAITSELDMVTLVLLDARTDLQKMLADLRIDLSSFPHLHFIRHSKELQIHSLPLLKPVLGPYQDLHHARLFRCCHKKPRSVAVIPLLRQNKLIGYLNLGSLQADRFQHSMATDFIERLGSIIAICLENVLNNERLVYIGLTDPLTQVSNRRYVEQRMLEEIARARRQNYSIACMYLDIDYFKNINDQCGHQGGDDVLCEVARRIKAELRLSDTLGRFGGEEFVVLLINTSLHDAALVAERIRRSIASSPFALTDGGQCKTSISIGLTVVGLQENFGDANHVAREMLARADHALYAAKHGGRNRVCYQ